MGKSYKDMYKINEFAEELISELQKFNDYLRGEVEYMGRDMIAAEIRAETDKWGEDDTAAVDVSDAAVLSINEEIEEWIRLEHPEIDTIRKILPLLKQLTTEEELDLFDYFETIIGESLHGLSDAERAVYWNTPKLDHCVTCGIVFSVDNATCNCDHDF